MSKEITFTEDEYEWLAITAAKLKRNIKRLTDDPTTGMSEKTIDRMAVLFNGHADKLTFALSRRQLRMIQGLTSDSVSALVDEVIPGYQKRAQDQPDQAARYKEYEQQARETLEIVDSVLEKVEGAL